MPKSTEKETDELQKVAEPVDTEQQDVPEQAQSDTADSSKAQVCNVSTFRTVSCRATENKY